MKHADYKVPGGKLLRISADIENGIIRDIKITGDFFMHPEDAIERLEATLKGTKVDELLKAKIERAIAGATIVGASPSDFVRAIKMCSEE
jgi:lipoate---protein ligase